MILGNVTLLSIGGFNRLLVFGDIFTGLFSILILSSIFFLDISCKIKMSDKNRNIFSFYFYMTTNIFQLYYGMALLLSFLYGHKSFCVRTLVLVDRSFWNFKTKILDKELRLVLILGIAALPTSKQHEQEVTMCKNWYCCFMYLESLFFIWFCWVFWKWIL